MNCIKKSLTGILILSANILGYSQQVANPEDNKPAAVNTYSPISVYPNLNDYTGITQKNFIRTFTLERPLNIAYESSVILNQNVYPSIIETKYYDNFGRIIQEVSKSGTGTIDLVKAHTYDNLGRETYNYLPFSTNTSDGKLKENPLTLLNAEYNYNYSGQEPYSKLEYDNSPLSRVVKQYNPGKNLVGSNNGKTIDYLTNVTGITDELWLAKFSVGPNSTDLPVLDGYYDDLDLLITKTIDEDGHYSYEAKDKLGKLIFTASYISSNTITYPIYLVQNNFAFTYNVYDDFGNVRYVLSPKACNQISGSSVTQNVADELCYKYFYDKKGRLIERKVPGKDNEYFVFDKLDRVVMYQDGNMRLSNQWLSYIYDVLDRPIAEAIYTSTQSRAALENEITSPSQSYSNQTLMYYLTGYNTYRNPFTYSIQTTDATLIKRNYYDDYNYTGISAVPFDLTLQQDLQNFTSFAVPFPSSQSIFTRDLTTCTANRIQNPDGTWPNSWTLNVNFYNDKSQLIQTYGLNYNNSVDIESYQYYFDGKVAAIGTKHIYNGQTTTLVKRISKLNYQSDKIYKIEQKINGGSYTTINESSYDFLGRLNNKKLGGSFDNIYTYNIQNLLTGINPAYVDNGTFSANFGPFFGEKISYDQGFQSKLYNGNIAGIQWRNSNGDQQQFYGYSYDKLNRLNHAEYGKWDNTSSTWSKAITDYTASNITYDENGNILTMDQRGPTLTSSTNATVIPGDMDKLVYSYFPVSNKLKSVTENATSLPIAGNPDFRDDPSQSTQDYNYDGNGNQNMDLNKGLGVSTPNLTTYNIANKPLKINVDNKGTIEFTYDADGNQLRKTITPVSSAQEIWDYQGNFVYKDNALQYILNDDGRIRPITTTSGTDYTFDFFIKDHLQNVREVVGTQAITVSGGPIGPPFPTLSPLLKTYVATMEISQAAIEGLLWDEIDPVRDPKPGSTSTTDVNAARLNGSESGREIGTAIMLRVMPGDQFEVSGSNYYEDPVSQEEPLTGSQLASALLGILSGGTVNGTPVSEMDENNQIIHGAIGSENFANTLDALNANDDPSLPSSHLNYVVFDENLQPIQDESGALQATGSNGWTTTGSNGNITINHPGYILMFTANNSAMNVWWDQMTITVYKGSVLEENHYYPFGLTLSQQSSNPLEKNNYKLTTKELHDELGLNWYNFGARMFDEQVGRWNGVDASAENYYDQGTYNYVANNPTGSIDPDGKGILDVIVGAAVAVLDNASGLNLRGNWHPTTEEAKHDYNQGQNTGDVASVLIGSNEEIGGAGIAAGSVDVTYMSGGLAAEYSVPAAVAGGAIAIHGRNMVANGSSNLGSQKGRVQEGKPSSPGKMQQEVIKGQAPKDVDHVDGPHQDGQKPHVHYKDGTNSNNDGTHTHDKGKGVPNPSNKVINWLLKHNWVPPNMAPPIEPTPPIKPTK